MLIRAALEDHRRIRVVGEAENGQEALELVRRERPDVLVLDLAMPVMDGRQTLEVLRAEGASTRVVILTGFGRDRLGPKVLEAGAFAYIEKGAAPDAICRTVLDAWELRPGRRAARRDGRPGPSG